MSKILFPIEIYENQKNAFVYAAKIAQITNSELILLAGIPSKNFNDFKSHEYYLNEEVKKINKYIERLKNFYIKRFSPLGDYLKIQIEYRYKEGNLMHQIFKACVSEKLDLIVFTLYNHRSTDEKHANSLTEKFARKGIDILVIPEDSYYLTLNNIIYTTGFENKISLQNLTRITKIVLPTKAELHILHNQTITRNSEEFSFLRKLKKQIPIKIHRKKDLTEIMHYVITKNIDMMIIQKKERYFFNKIFTDSFENKILIQTRIPILIVNRK